MGSNLPHSNINEWAKWYHSNFKNVLPHTKMAGRDKNDRTNSRTICQQNRIAFSLLETLFCGRKQFSAAVLPQDEHWSLTIMQQTSPWDALLEERLTTQDRSRRNRFCKMAWQNQAQYSFQILMTNCVIGVQSNSQEMAPSANVGY